MKYRQKVRAMTIGRDAACAGLAQQCSKLSEDPFNRIEVEARGRGSIDTASLSSACGAWSFARREQLEEADDRLFTLLQLPAERWKSAQTIAPIEQAHEEFVRRIKTQTLPPSIETAAVILWALMASGQSTMRKIDAWRGVTQAIDLAA